MLVCSLVGVVFHYFCLELFIVFLVYPILFVQSYPIRSYPILSYSISPIYLIFPICPIYPIYLLIVGKTGLFLNVIQIQTIYGQP